MEELQEQITQYTYYLEEIRRRFFRLLIVFILVFAAAFFGAGYIISLSIKLFRIPQVVLTASSPFQYLDLAMNVGFFFATLVILPMFIYQAYIFLKSALTKREQKIFRRFVPLIVILFLVGFFYGIASMYIAFIEMAKLNTSIGLTNMWDISKFFSQMLTTSTLLAILFQTPIILTILIRLGFVKVDYLIKKQRHAIAAIFIFVALLPPTDPVSLILMALPLLLLYYLTIIINRGYRNEFPLDADISLLEIKQLTNNQLTKEKIYV